MNTIVVGLDGSKGAQAAATWAASQAREHDAHVVAVHAIPRTELWAMSALQVDIDKVLAEFKQLLDGPWTAPVRSADVEYTTPRRAWRSGNGAPARREPGAGVDARARHQ